VLLGHVVLSIAHASFVDPLASQVLEKLVKVLAHGVELLVNCVAESEDGEMQILEVLPLILLFELLDPLIEPNCVVARLSLVVGGHAHEGQLLLILAELLLLKVLEIDDLNSVKDLELLGLLLQNLGEFLSSARLATEVDPQLAGEIGRNGEGAEVQLLRLYLLLLWHHLNLLLRLSLAFCRLLDLLFRLGTMK